MNNYSLNETASLARLAARGAGYHWGLADEVYRSVFWLAQRNLPAPLLLSQLLKSYGAPNDVELAMPTISDGHVSARRDALCPILLGCSLVDRIDASIIGSTVTFDAVRCPLLIFPFIVELAIKFDCIVMIKLESADFVTDGTQVRFSSPAILELEHANAGCIHFRRSDAIEFSASEELPLRSRVNVDHEVWKTLKAFAHHTYAPATDASRLSGAGAGVSDND